MSFWSEYSHDEIMSMHGADYPGYDDEDIEYEEKEPEEHECSGCSYCLMTEW